VEEDRQEFLLTNVKGNRRQKLLEGLRDLDAAPSYVAMGVAMAPVLEPGVVFATVQSGVSYLRAVKEGRLEAAARVVQRGRTTGHLECEITDGEGRQVARVTSVCAIRRGER
jgi:acyl-CoA thioesterase FadM